MKYTYIFFILLIQNFSFAQDSRLFENNWYLKNLTVNGSDNFPPSNNIYLVFDHQNSMIIAGTYCNYLFGEDLYVENNLSDFSLTNWNATLLICLDIYYYENLYFNFFIENGNTNNFTYSISEIGNVKTLTVNSMFNKQAIYSSEMLSTIESKTLDFSIYPNPASEYIYVKHNNQNFENAQVAVYNSLGELCKTENINLNHEKINVQNLTSGIYLMKIETSNGTVTKKIIKL